MTTPILTDLTHIRRLCDVSFARMLKAQNKSPATVAAYSSAVRQFADYLEAHGMPTSVAGIHREHCESFIAHLVERYKPATANNPL